MNNLQLDWDTNSVDPTNQFDALDAGQAVSLIDGIEPKQTSTGGMMFVLTHTILDGQYAGRKLFHNCNVKNQSAKAEQIGREQIAQIQTAVGCYGSNDLSQVMNKPILIKWNKKHDAQYGDQNNITSWKPATTTQQAPQQPQQTQQESENPAPSWAR